jgi:hypothetical protein
MCVCKLHVQTRALLELLSVTFGFYLPLHDGAAELPRAPDVQLLATLVQNARDTANPTLPTEEHTIAAVRRAVVCLLLARLRFLRACLNPIAELGKRESSAASVTEPVLNTPHEWLMLQLRIGTFGACDPSKQAHTVYAWQCARVRLCTAMAS